MKRVLVTGGTGLVGRNLIAILRRNGYEVAILSRKSNPDKLQFQWNVNTKTIDERALAYAENIVHLQGANVGEKRWSNKRKIEIFDSRVTALYFLLEKLKEKNIKPKSLVSASAIGYYGTESEPNKIFNETDEAGQDYLATLCKAWEEAAFKFQELGTRVSIVRSGIAIDKSDLAIKSLALPVALGVGSPLGSGKQFMPWIHVFDLARVYFHLLLNENISGVFNGVSSQHITNKEIVKALGKILRRPIFMPNVPSFVLKFMFGEMSQVMLNGNPVSNQKLLNSGFELMFTDFDSALHDIFKDTANKVYMPHCCN